MTVFSHHETGLRDCRADSKPQESRVLRWLLLVVALGLMFVLGFATRAAADEGYQRYQADQAAQPSQTPRFTVDIVEQRECLELVVRPRIMLPMSHSDIRVEMRIARHPDHAQFSLAWDGGLAGAGGSAQSLHGADEPFLHVRTIKNQPAAPWQVVAGVFDQRGTLLRRQTASIIVPEGIP